EQRRGKSAVLNDLVAKARGEIVVLADARQRFEAPVIHALVEPFADPRVGAVSGELILTHDADDASVGRGVGFYWRYEKFIRGHGGRGAAAGGPPRARVPTPARLVGAVPRRPDPRRRLRPAAHQPPRLPRALRAVRARVRPGGHHHRRGVRPQGPDDRGQL